MNPLAAPDATALACTRILIVEDDDCLYRALRDSLEDAGCEVFGSCKRLCYPMDTVPASRLDAALVDMDPLGSDRAASLTQLLGARNIPIVWITSRWHRAVSPDPQSHEWMRKPFTERELLDSIASAVGRKSADE